MQHFFLLLDHCTNLTIYSKFTQAQIDMYIFIYKEWVFAPVLGKMTFSTYEKVIKGHFILKCPGYPSNSHKLFNGLSYKAHKKLRPK